MPGQPPQPVCERSRRPLFWPPSARPLTPAFKPQPLQVLAKLRSKVGPLQRKLHRRLQHPKLVARIEPLALKGVTEDLLFLDQRLDTVGQLNLAASAGIGLL